MKDQKDYLCASTFTPSTNIKRALTLDKGIFDKKNVYATQLLTLIAYLGIDLTTEEDVLSQVIALKFSKFIHLTRAKGFVELRLDQYPSEKHFHTFLQKALNKLEVLCQKQNDIEIDDILSNKYDKIGELKKTTINAKKTKAASDNFPKKTEAFGVYNRPVDLKIIPETDRYKWTANRIDQLFEKFFSGETSDITTYLSKEKYLEHMCAILEVPIPPQGPGGQPNMSHICSTIINNATEFITAFHQNKAKYGKRVNRISTIKEFYGNILKESSEEIMLQSLRRVLGYAQKEMNESLIKEINYNNQDDVTKNFTTLSKNLIEMEKARIRHINWIGIENYRQNLDLLYKKIDIIPATPDSEKTEKLVRDEAEISFTHKGIPVLQLFFTNDFKLYYNPLMLPYIDQAKNINLYGIDEVHNLFEMNLAASFIIGGFKHELGHFKYIDGNEVVANREMGSRYAYLNYIANVIVTSV